MKKMIRTLLASILALALLTSSALAFQPDESYTYDDNLKVPSTNAYQVKQVINGTTMGTTDLKAAQDIFVDNNDHVYILDSGNFRVLVLDENYQCIRELKDFRYNGETVRLGTDAQGLFYQEATGLLYITDTTNNRILISDLEGNLQHVYGKPDTDLLAENLIYAPRKIIVDNMGIMYVTSKNINTGALLIDADNSFLGFYGINAIAETWEVMLEYAWRAVLTDAQNAQSGYSFQPTEFYNLFWANDRFVYAVSPYSDTVAAPVAKLNAVGHDILETNVLYGDLVTGSANKTPAFIDITVDDEGVFTVIDLKTGTLFQYDDSSNLLCAFGGLGTQQGLFTTPSALKTDSQNQLLVLDAKKNTVTVLCQTYYGEKIREATRLHNVGLYEVALEHWEEIARMNPNYHLAYVGMGKAYMEMEDYEQAKAYFKLARDQENYAVAKEALRGVLMHENFALIAGIVVGLMLLVLFSDFLKNKFAKLYEKITHKKLPEKTAKRSGFAEMSPYRYPLYILLHPKDGFQEMRMNKKGSLLMAWLIVFGWLFVEVFHRTVTDFDMNAFDPGSTSMLRVGVITVIIYLMACVANWCFCTLLDGKGKLRDIMVVGAYSLLPYVIVRFIAVVLSHILVGPEQILLTYCIVISVIWAAIMALIGLSEIHEYSMKKVFLSVFLTLVGIIIMLFLSLIVIKVYQQLYYFIGTVIFELRY